jgi:heme/copper-type cytochrome/quinol oxidase subunit 2
MSLEKPTEAPPAPVHSRTTSRLELWFGLLGGGVAWSWHLLSAYLIAEFGCVSGLGERHVAGVSVVAWLILAASAIALLVVGAALWVAYRSRERLAREADPANDDDDTAPELSLARTGFITSVIFLMIIAVQTIPIFFYLRNC